MPICRFILMSLPLESLVRDTPTPPMAIDYACGAGHFLTELALQLQPLLEQHKPLVNPAEYHKSMVGIEKEYRLSKVAKVSAFMYGQQGIQVCYGDGLMNSHEAFPDIRDGHFDLLVANPPYSVRGFLETLPEEERKAYSLTDTINDAETANSIETFFIERAKQLLKSGGVAAIILPSSILSNGGSTYIRAREILLQYFDIVAIAEFGSGTFGKTGTNTVTLFLRRKPTQPDTAEHYRERVDEWFKGCGTSKRKQVIYKDGHLIEQYCTHIHAPLADYQSLLRGEADGSWKQQEHFQPYHDAFEKSTELKNIKKTKKFKAMSRAEQTAEIAKRYLAYVQTIERDKLYHFCLASDQANPALIIRSPSGTKEIKQFLGYEWSSAKGDEGIKLIEDASGKHITTLYDGPDHANPMRFTRSNPAKLNSHIAANFDGTIGAIPAELSEVANLARLVDMLDFSKSVFEKTLSLSPSRSIAIPSKWPLTNLGNIVNVLIGGTPARKNPAYFTGENPWVSIGEMAGSVITDTKEKITDRAVKESNVKLIPKGTTLLSFKLSIGKTAIAGCDLYTNEAIAGLIPKDNKVVLNEYLFQIFNSGHINLDVKGLNAFGKSLNSKILREEVKIPLPPIKEQKEVIAECEKIDTEVEAASKTVVKTLATIDSDISAVYASTAPRIEIAKLSTNIQYGLNEKMNEAGIGYKIFRMNEIIQGRMVDNGAMKCADISAEEFAKYRLNKGDLLFIRSNGSLEHIGKVGLFDLDGDYCYASYLVRIVPELSKALPQYLACIMNSPTFRKGMVQLAVKSGGTNNINATKMKNIKVPVPSLAEQKKFVAKVETLEKQIAAAQAVIDAAPARKEAVMKKYL